MHMQSTESVRKSLDSSRPLSSSVKNKSGAANASEGERASLPDAHMLLLRLLYGVYSLIVRAATRTAHKSTSHHTCSHPWGACMAASPNPASTHESHCASLDARMTALPKRSPAKQSSRVLRVIWSHWSSTAILVFWYYGLLLLYYHYCLFLLLHYHCCQGIISGTSSQNSTACTQLQTAQHSHSTHHSSSKGRAVPHQMPLSGATTATLSTPLLAPRSSG